MQRGAVLKKRPCKICRRWFPPHPRLKERQKTCGAILAGIVPGRMRQMSTIFKPTIFRKNWIKRLNLKKTQRLPPKNTAQGLHFPVILFKR